MVGGIDSVDVLRLLLRPARPFLVETESAQRSCTLPPSYFRACVTCAILGRTNTGALAWPNARAIAGANPR